MARYRVRMKVMTIAVYEVEADSPLHARGKVSLALQMGYDERLGFVQLEQGEIVEPTEAWDVQEVRPE